MTDIHLAWYTGAWDGLADKATDIVACELAVPLDQLHARQVLGALALAQGARNVALHHLTDVTSEYARLGVVDPLALLAAAALTTCQAIVAEAQGDPHRAAGLFAAAAAAWSALSRPYDELLTAERGDAAASRRERTRLVSPRWRARKNDCGGSGLGGMPTGSPGRFAVTASVSHAPGVAAPAGTVTSSPHGSSRSSAWSREASPSIRSPICSTCRPAPSATTYARRCASSRSPPGPRSPSPPPRRACSPTQFTLDHIAPGHLALSHVALGRSTPTTDRSSAQSIGVRLVRHRGSVTCDQEPVSAASEPPNDQSSPAGTPPVRPGEADRWRQTEPERPDLDDEVAGDRFEPL